MYEDVIRLYAFTRFNGRTWTAEFDGQKTEGRSEEAAINALVEILREEE